MKRVLSLLMAVWLTLSLLSGMVFAADETVGYTLSDNDILVGLNWTESSLPETYTFGGHTYTLTWGKNAFSSAQQACDAVPTGGVVILTPGTYTGNIYVKKNMTLLGAKAGIDPNTRGVEETDDWTLTAGRGTNETILTGIIHIGVNGATVYSDCKEFTLDGIQIIGEGQIRSNSGSIGQCTIALKNIYLLNSTKTTSPIYLNSFYGTSNEYLRYVTIQNLRVEGQTKQTVMMLTTEKFDLSGLYMAKDCTQPLLKELMTSWAEASTDPISYKIHDSMFRCAVSRVMYLNIDRAALTQSGKIMNRDIELKNKATIIVDNCTFVNPDSKASSLNWTVAKRLSSANVYFEITNNTFISDTAVSSNYAAIAGYTENTELDCSGNVIVSRNKFIRVGTAYVFANAGGTVDLSGNYYEDSDGTVGARFGRTIPLQNAIGIIPTAL